ncbi:MAG TPA: T9SS type A sorting domain-containing protein, partial [bacterium]|nr:T9SS type A sorting domain-containing protein [bacterium]
TPPSGKPMSFGLFQNYPNPARDDTVFKYTLPARAEVELVVYDLSGRRVATVAKDVREAGVYEERYGLMDDGGKPLPAGVYLYRLSAGADVATKKMVVVH